VFSMFYGETIVTKTIDYQASFLILNGTAVIENIKKGGGVSHPPPIPQYKPVKELNNIARCE
ncbi:MAG: hypothetical protein ABW087_05350, partial [Candidatus Thiodiazotropha sp.]